MEPGGRAVRSRKGNKGEQIDGTVAGISSTETKKGPSHTNGIASSSSSSAVDGSSYATAASHSRSTSLVDKIDGGHRQSTRRRKKSSTLSGDEDDDDDSGAASALPSPYVRGNHEKATRLGGFLRPAGPGQEGFLDILSSAEWKILACIVVLACAIRLFRLSYPTSVV